MSLSPMQSITGLYIGNIGNRLIRPYHAWISSADNLYFDGLGYILLDTGTASIKYNLTGYNGAGAEGSRTTLSIGGGKTVPAINYDGSTHGYFFRGTTSFTSRQPLDYIEAILKLPQVADNYNCAFATTNLTDGTSRPGFAFGVDNSYFGRGIIQAGVSGTQESYKFSNQGVYTDCEFFGMWYPQTSPANFRFANISSTTPFTYAAGTLPLTIGCYAGSSGSAGVYFANRPIGPVLYYRGITPSNVANFLAKRRQRVLDGTWQPYIPVGDLAV